MKNDLLKIINTYGVLPQLKYFYSEVYELSEAIINAEDNRLIGISRKPSELAIEHIAEEIADVTVMLKQLQYYYGIEDKDINDVLTNVLNKELKKYIQMICKEKQREASSLCTYLSLEGGKN